MSLSILEYIANTKMVNRFENWAVKERPAKNNAAKKVTNLSKLQNVYPTVFMLLTTGIQTSFIYKDKEMPKERKIPLMLNNMINCVISVAGGLLIAKPSNKFVDKMLQRADIFYANNANKTNLTNGIKTAVPFLVTALLFKYIGPVLATPLADKANKFLVKKGLVDYSNDS